MSPAVAAGSAPKADDDSEIVCEGGVCYKKPKEAASSANSLTDTSPTEPSLASSLESTISNEEKLQRAKELLDKKRKEKEEETARVG